MQLTFLLHENEAKYRQIYAHIKQLIETKMIHENEKLPSIRALAENLHVSRNTTLLAYELLLAEGYIRTEPKKGYYVNHLEPLYLQQAAPIKQTVPRETAPDVINFRLGAVDAQHFPLKKWRQLSNALLKEANAYTYGENFGEPPLKEQLAHYLMQARGMHVMPEQIIIGSSTQQLLLHISFLLKESFSSIIVEDPGYTGVREVFTLQQFQLEAITVTESGIQLDELAQKNSALIYVTPSHHYPLGTALSISERLQLIQWAYNVDGYILEDDYDSEYRYAQKTLPALASLDQARIVYFGTFSKAFLPGIRLAYMVLPAPLLTRFKQTFQHVEHNASLLHQLTMAEFMRSGEWERHIKRMRMIYKKKMNVLTGALLHHFGEQIDVIGTKAGLYLLIRVHTKQTEAQLIEKAHSKQVNVYETSSLFFGTNQTKPHLLLGFANLTEAQLKEGVARLKVAWGDIF
ncbi:MAG: PLP-dependent aminotransferase family protein [Solibacillus sp.]